MSEKTGLFEFVGRQTRYVWIKLLEGGDAGMHLAVPRRDSEYDSEVRCRLENASPGEQFQVTLEPAPELETNLRISAIKSEDETEVRTDPQVAAD
jgi:hypothetical protein